MPNKKPVVYDENGLKICIFKNIQLGKGLSLDFLTFFWHVTSIIVLCNTKKNGSLTTVRMSFVLFFSFKTTALAGGSACLAQCQWYACRVGCTSALELYTWRA